MKDPTGSLGAHHACWPLFSWGTCWPWYLRHRRPRCIAPYAKAWTSTRLRRTTSRASRRRGHPRACVRFVGGVSNNAFVTEKARHIVCASCVYMCKLIVCKLIVHCASCSDLDLIGMRAVTTAAFAQFISQPIYSR